MPRVVRNLDQMFVMHPQAKDYEHRELRTYYVGV